MSSVVQTTGFAFTSESIHMVHLSYVGWHCWIMYCFWGGFTWGFSFFFPQEEHSSNAGPTRADWCSDGWHCQVLEVFALGPWWLGRTFYVREPARANQLFMAWIAPEEIWVLFESHAVKTTCDLDKSRSPFGGCVTMSWHLCGFSRPTMQGTESVVAVLIPDTSFWQKCWDIRCQWLLCISRLVSKHRQVMLDCTLGKTGNGEDHWCSSHKLINEVNTRACLLLYGRLGLLLPRRAFTSSRIFWKNFKNKHAHLETQAAPEMSQRNFFGPCIMWQTKVTALGDIYISFVLKYDSKGELNHQ